MEKIDKDMNARTLFLALSASLLLMVGCQKEDRIVPDVSNPFFGIYSPSGQINEVSSNSETLLATQWIGRRLVNVSLANLPVSGDPIVNQYNYDSHNRLASIDSNIFCSYNSDSNCRLNIFKVIIASKLIKKLCDIFFINNESTRIFLISLSYDFF